MKATYVARHHWPKLLAGSSPPVWARLSFTVLPHPSGTARG